MFYGDAGNDILISSGEHDTLHGGNGNTILIGGTGHNTLRGGAGDDILIGGTGNDHLYGGDGDDILIGSAGHDTLRGGAGNDILIGGDGKDTFYWSVDELDGATDHVLDFDAAHDRIVLDGITAEAGFSLGYRNTDITISKDAAIVQTITFGTESAAQGAAEQLGIKIVATLNT